MDYVIKNHKNVYIRLNKNGTAVTCAEHERSLFEESKARNILNGLPKTLKRLNFRLEAIPDIKSKEELVNSAKKEVIENNNYIVPNTVKQWVEKFGVCDDILKEAQKRREELNDMWVHSPPLGAQANFNRIEKRDTM